MSYFLKRCDSMLAHINLVGRVNVWDIHEDDLRVIKQLVTDRKIKITSDGVHDYYASINAPLYTYSFAIVNPVAFHLAASNPANEHFVNVFRKNWYVPELVEYIGKEIVDDLTASL